MSKDEKCTCKACKNTVFQCQICKFVGFLLPSLSWLFKPGFHIVVSVVSVVSCVRKEFIGPIEFILSRTTSCIYHFFCIEFSWTPVKEEEEEDVERTAVSKLERSRIEQNEATDTASEGEGDELRVSGLTLTSQKTQTYEDDFCDDSIDISFRVPCLHRFSLSHLLSKSTTPSKEEKMFSHFTGFDSYAGFMDTLKFILPNLDRKLLIYWDSTAGKSSVIDTEKLFEENESDLEEDRDEDEPEIRETKTRPSAHKLQVEDEFLMVLMKLRMGLSNIALGERFNLSDSAVNNILLTWLNYIYEVLGSLKIWPHRDVILKNAPQEFIDKYPNNTVIIDATELKIQISNANTWLQ